jgi:S-adenosylmethionine:tRNA ribosyltransferase-isomerase
MHISDYDYELPPDLIAREPARPRDSSRMMVLNRATGQWIDTTFLRLPELLEPSDVLILNDTRVIRARVRGRLENGREVEVFFASPAGPNAWEVLVRPGRRIRTGDRIIFANGELEATFGEYRRHGVRLLHLDEARNSPPGTGGVAASAGVVSPESTSIVSDHPALRAPLLYQEGSTYNFLERHGDIPIPPYLEREATPADATEYQTVYANSPGAVVAPTAGLHFTDRIFEKLHTRGIEIVKLTLHVGIGTFIPVRTDDPREHILKPERFELSAESADRLNAARDAGRRLIAVGTTSTRTLEYIAQKHDCFEACSGEADLFILPGYEFKAVDGMLTNFHLPRSTLIMLVSAFASRERILNAYRHAVDARYRFYSYGDCMLIC